MFGLSKQEKKESLNSKYKSELKELLNNMSVSLDNNGRSMALSGGYDNADTLHNVYSDFGYPVALSFSNFWNMYRRFGVAGAVVDIPPNLSWLMPPSVEGKESFLNDFNLLCKKTNLWNRLKGLDKRQRVGSYAGLFIEVADNKRPSEEVETLNGIGQIHNLKPIYEGQLRVSDTQQDVTKPFYGEPTMYEFVSSGDGSKSTEDNASFKIHPSRLIIAAEGADDGSIYGVSSLENIYNDLLDLRKISGAGGEGFYQNTRSAPIIKAVDGFQAPKSQKEKDALEQQIDDFLGKWQKKFVSKGLEFVYPNISLDNPKEFAQNSWNNISAGSGIASAILMGQQMGVRASDKDFELLMIMIQSRRENFLNEIVAQVIDWFIKHGVLENVEYVIEWDDMSAASDDAKIKIADAMAGINEKSFRSGLSAVYEVDEVRQVSGFDQLDYEMPSEDLGGFDDI